MKAIIIDKKIYKLSKKDYNDFNKSYGIITNSIGNRFYHITGDNLSDFLDWVVDNKKPINIDIVGIYD